MNRLHVILLVVVATIVSHPAPAHDGDSCLIVEELNTTVCHHYFGGTSVEVPVRTTLDQIDTTCDELVVTVMQRQGIMLAELRDPFPLDPGTCETTESIALELPVVRSETDLLVQFSAPGSDRAFGSIALRVYAPTLLMPLLKFAEQNPLVVFDEDGTLSAFLERHDVEFARQFEPIDEPAVALLVRPREPERWLNDRDIATAIIFQEKIMDLPQIRTIVSNGQTRVYVEMPLLQKLNDNPLAQKALLNIIRLATSPHAIERG